MNSSSSNQASQLDVEAALARARAARRAGQPDEMEMACAQVLAVWPGQAEASYLMGLMAHEFGNLDLAVDYLRQACLSPRAPAHIYSDFAEMCRQAGLLPEGERAARRAVALQPDFGAAWNNLGIILQESLKLDESRACLERAAALAPSDAHTINNLANTYKRLGMAADAEARWRAALDLKPDYAEVYSNLANLYIDQGDYARAEEMARRAIELQPRLADAYVNLAGVATACHREDEALRVLDALLSFSPGHPRALAAKALTLKALDRLDEARDYAERAVAAAPSAPESYNALGQVFQARDEFEPALAAYGRGAELPGPAQVDAAANRATLYVEFGRKEEGREWMEQAARQFPHAPGLLFAQTELRKFKRGDPLIARMETTLAQEGVTLANRVTLHFGLGKVYLDLDDSERAFRHYDEGNRLKRTTYMYDAAENEAWMASVGEVFSRDFVRAKTGLGPATDLPVFVVGMPRSGTTLTEQIIASHPMARGAGELATLHKLCSATSEFPTGFGSLSDEQWRSLGEGYLAYVAPLSEGCARVVDKMPSNFLYCGVMRIALPGARIIHCRRDPVDTCLSCYTKLFAGEQSFAYDQSELGRYYRAYDALTTHWRATLPASHFLEVQYEEVVADIEGQTRRILDFIGLPWDDACLRFHETQRPVRTASVNQVRQPLYATSVGRWRKHAAQLKPLLAALGIEAA